MSEDYLITLLSKEKNIHGYIATVTNTAREIQQSHNMNIISSAIFSRALTAAVLLSGNLKNDHDTLSLKWECNGPAKNIFVEITGKGNVKGYIGENNLPLIEKSIFNDTILSEPYIGFGELYLTRSSFTGTRPYNSVTVIETGEIAEDVSLHLHQSLQVESALKIGLSIDRNNNIETCGGILFMAMPNCSNEEIEILHRSFNDILSLTDLLKDSKENLNTIKNYFEPLELEIISIKKITFFCNCNVMKIKNIMKSLKKDELDEYLNDKGNFEATCQYCGKKYSLSKDSLE